MSRSLRHLNNRREFCSIDVDVAEECLMCPTESNAGHRSAKEAERNPRQ